MSMPTERKIWSSVSSRWTMTSTLSGPSSTGSAGAAVVAAASAVRSTGAGTSVAGARSSASATAAAAVAGSCPRRASGGGRRRRRWRRRGRGSSRSASRKWRSPRRKWAYGSCAGRHPSTCPWEFFRVRTAACADLDGIVTGLSRRPPDCLPGPEPPTVRRPAPSRVTEPDAARQGTTRGTAPRNRGNPARSRPREEARRRPPAAHQGGLRPDGARPAPRPHGADQQDGAVPAARPRGDLPDRRLHGADRRPDRPQRHAPAAHARGREGERRDLRGADLQDPRPEADRGRLQLALDGARWAPRA